MNCRCQVEGIPPEYKAAGIGKLPCYTARMNLSFGLSVAVMLAGLIVMAMNKRWAEIAYVAFAMGLLATLLRMAGSASLHIGG